MKSIDILRLVATAYGFRFLEDDQHLVSTVSNYLNSSDAPKPEHPRGDACNALRRAMELFNSDKDDRPPTLEEVRRVLNYYRL